MAQANTPNWKTRMRDRAVEMGDNPIMMGVAMTIFIILVSLALKLIQVNLVPYLKVMGLPEFRPSNMPIIGWGFDVLTLCYVATGAVILWFLINLAQIVWILISLDRAAHRTAIRESKLEMQVQGTDYESDSRVRKLKRQAVGVPFFFIGASGWIALAAFTVEFLINLKAYPPIKSWRTFSAGLTIGDLSPINFNELLKILWGCFSTELVVVALIIVGQWIWSHKKANQYTP